ncbi:hypothetical protein SAMN05421690_104816 [Nitrosomonas sp. Nm51]|nr:hypothetical protein SAMN05421690_104816 [Nitrosomonas sp. Nm51]
MRVSPLILKRIEYEITSTAEAIFRLKTEVLYQKNGTTNENQKKHDNVCRVSSTLIEC